MPRGAAILPQNDLSQAGKAFPELGLVAAAQQQEPHDLAEQLDLADAFDRQRCQPLRGKRLRPIAALPARRAGADTRSAFSPASARVCSNASFSSLPADQSR